MMHYRSRYLFNAFAIILILSTSTLASAQTFNAIDKYHTLLVGSSFKDTIYSSIDIRSINNFVDPFGDLEVGVRNITSTQFEITFDFSKSGFQGNKLVEINTLDAVPTISVKHRYNFSLVKSIVIANDDFVKIEGNATTIIIDPLANDIFNDAFTKKLVVSDSKYGKATLSGGLVEYTIPAQFEEDVITYTVENITKTQSKAAIYLYKDQKVNKDNIKSIVVSEKSEYLIILPTKLNAVITPPLNGIITKINDQAYKYTNSRLGNGTDKVLFSVGNYKTTYNISLKAKEVDGGLVKDDEVYGGVNQSITFNVFANDLSKGTVYNYSKELVYLGNGLFSYTPASNFTGTVKFFYDAGSKLKREVGIITIHVGNIEPSNSHLYNFSVKRNGRHSFSYETPLNGYQISIVSHPKKGGASAYQQIDPIGLACGKIQGKAVVEYVPMPGYSGKDSMIISYKLGTQPAKTYMLRYTIFNENADCDCGTDCVWPGDVNKDGVVTPLDILGIGKNYGNLGANRVATSTNWFGSAANDWTNNATSTNSKYADTNGDGVIDRSDVQAIAQNLGKTSALVPSAYGTGRTFPFQLVPHQTEVDSGDLVTFDIVVGNLAEPLLDVYGLAFNVRINPGFLHDQTVQVKFDQNSWLGHLSPLIDFYTKNETGLLTSAISRTHIKGISGTGILGTVVGVVKDEINGFFDDESDHYFQSIIPTGIVLENSKGEQITGVAEPVKIKVNRKKTQKVSVEDQVMIYPNPTQGDFYIALQGQDKIIEVEIYDMAGQLIKKYSDQNSKQVAIVLEGLKNGIYFAKITTDTNQLTKKISLVR
jgi:hypothetical protein